MQGETSRAIEIGPATHLAFLDGARALAALFVLLGHAWQQVWPTEYGRLPSGVAWHLTAWLLYGHYAVNVFIVLSGYCLMLPIVRGDGTLRGGAAHFFRKRARRILPPYYLAMGLSLLLIATCIGRKTGTHWDVSVPVTRGGLLAHLILVQDVFGKGQINHAFWSIAVEWQIYFFFPALVVLWRRAGGLPTMLGTLALSYVAFVLLRRTHYGGITPQYYGLFAVGMFGASVAFGRGGRWGWMRDRLPWGAAAAALTALVIALGYVMGWRWVFGYLGFIDLPVGLAALCLLVVASRAGPNQLRDLLSARPLSAIGAFSYSLYLVHAPLLQVAWLYGVRPLQLGDVASFALLSTAGTSIIVIIAYIFFLRCERPFLMRRPARPGRGAIRQEMSGLAPQRVVGKEADL